MTRRLLAATLFASLCAGAGCFDPEPHSLLSHNPSAKIPAIKDAVNQHDAKAIPSLIDDLSDNDPAVRFYAIEGLQRLTGQTFGYLYYQDAPQRREAVMKWKRWLNDQSTGEARGTASQPSPGP